MIEAGVRPELIEVIPNGVDQDAFAEIEEQA